MTAPKPLTAWQQTLPLGLPRHLRRNIIEGDGGCWLWIRAKDRDGYGSASLNNKTYQAHRLVFTLLRGQPPEGMVLDHLCRIRHCVNPAHLQPVTQHLNLLRSELTPAGMRTCAKGHAFTHNGRQRRCPVCLADYRQANAERRRAYLRDYHQRRKAA